MTWPWRLIGPLFIFLSVAFPVLIVTQDRKPLDTPNIVAFLGMAIFGLWQALYMYRYSATLHCSGFVLEGLHLARRVEWRDVVRVEIDQKAVRFSLVDGQIVKISIHFSHLRELLEHAETSLPPVAWSHNK